MIPEAPESTNQPKSSKRPQNIEQPARWLAWTTDLVLLLIALAYAFYTIFSQPLGIDEGYLMITVQSFLDGHALYDVVFTQYGPAYYVYEWILHSVLSIPLTHDATRWVCIFHWLVAAALLGIVARATTGSVLAGFFAFMQAVIHLSHLAREPGHPQEIIAILLAAALLAANRVGEKRWGLALLGVFAATLFFIKPNVGVFFGAALFLALYFHSDRSGRSASIRAWLLIVGCALLPFLLMRRHVMHEWCRNYSLVAAIAIVATGLIARGAAIQHLPFRRWLAPLMGFAVSAFVFTTIALITGTSFSGLLDGLLLTPLKTPNIAILPFRVSNLALASPALALLAAGFISMTAAKPWRDSLVTVLKLCFVLVNSFILIGKPHAQVMYVLPWVWLVALPRNVAAQPLLIATFPRVFLAVAAAWQSLQGYPVAGTQLAVGSLLLVVAAAICLTDAFRALRMPDRISTRVILWRGAATVTLVCLFAFAWCKLPATWQQYASLPRLDLPGARLVRTDAAMVDRYRALAQYLESNCDTFITCPGVNDFYFWTGKRPPTHLNPTTLSILTAQQQEQIVAALRRAERPLIVILASIVDDTRRRGHDSIRVVLEALRDDYVAVHEVSYFRIYARKPAGTP